MRHWKSVSKSQVARLALISLLSLSALVVASAPSVPSTHATIPLVQDTRGASFTGTPTCAYGSSPAQGDMLVVALLVAPYTTSISSVTDTLGNSFSLMNGAVQDGTTVNFGIEIYAAMQTHIAGADTVTVSLSGTQTDAFVTCSEIAGYTNSIRTSQNGGGTVTSGVSYLGSVSSLTPGKGDFVYAFAGVQTCGASNTPTYDTADG